MAILFQFLYAVNGPSLFLAKYLLRWYQWRGRFGIPLRMVWGHYISFAFFFWGNFESMLIPQWHLSCSLSIFSLYWGVSSVTALKNVLPCLRAELFVVELPDVSFCSHFLSAFMWLLDHALICFLDTRKDFSERVWWMSILNCILPPLFN